MGTHIRYPANPAQAASASQAGQITTGAQTFAGTKTFNSPIMSSSGLLQESNGLSTMVVKGGAGDGATAVGVGSDTNAAYSTGGAKIHSFRNNGVEKASVDKDGGIQSSGTLTISNYNVSVDGAGVGIGGTIYNNTGGAQSFKGGFFTAGAATVNQIFDGFTAQTVAGGKLVSFKNAGVEKAFVDKDGNVEVTTVGAGFILKSPDGTRYLIKVANGGALSTQAA